VPAGTAGAHPEGEHVEAVGPAAERVRRLADAVDGAVVGAKLTPSCQRRPEPPST